MFVILVEVWEGQFMLLSESAIVFNLPALHIYFRFKIDLGLDQRLKVL